MSNLCDICEDAYAVYMDDDGINYCINCMEEDDE